MGVGSLGLSSSSSSSLLSAFNAHSPVGSGGSRNTSNLGTIGSGSAPGAGLGGNSNQAQAAFLNAGPNRTVSNVGAQAAQGGMGVGSGMIGGYGSREYIPSELFKSVHELTRHHLAAVFS